MAQETVSAELRQLGTASHTMTDKDEWPCSQGTGLASLPRLGQPPGEEVDYEKADRVNGLLEGVFGSEEAGGLWSRGSAEHVFGTCKACHYIHTKEGCSNGLECKFCHLPHTSTDGSRVCVSKRSYCKQLLRVLRSSSIADPEALRELSEAVGQRSKYMQTIMQEERADLAGESYGHRAQPGNVKPRTLISL